MLNLEKRIAALEQASPALYTAMFIRFVAPGELDKEIQVISSHPDAANRKEWNREPDESVQDFQGRAEREATPSRTGRKLLMCT